MNGHGKAATGSHKYGHIVTSMITKSIYSTISIFANRQRYQNIPKCRASAFSPAFKLNFRAARVGFVRIKKDQHV
jgi:hypothetical protein